MSKEPIFIVAADSRKLDTEAEVFARLEADEAFLIKHHPSIDDEAWRTFINLIPEKKKDQLAIELINRLRALRDALKTPETSAWRIAVLAMRFQDMVMIYRQPVTQSTIGSINADKKTATLPNDASTMRVLRHLRNQGKTWKDTLLAIESAASNLTNIAEVEIQQEGKRIYFSHEEDEENFTVSTLQRKKFPKAR